MFDVAGEMRRQIWLLHHEIAHGLALKFENRDIIHRHRVKEMIGLHKHRHVVE
jgi:hypothetical protein